jgi:hypothetical protein
MSYEQKESYGALFKNDTKGNANAPAYKGDIMLGGNLWEISAWVKLTKAGIEFYSLSGKPKTPKPTAPKEEKPVPPAIQKAVQGGAFDNFDDDLAF